MSVGVSKNDVITILRPRVRILNTTSMLSSIYIVKMDTLFDIELWKGKNKQKQSMFDPLIKSILIMTINDLGRQIQRQNWNWWVQDTKHSFDKSYTDFKVSLMSLVLVAVTTKTRLQIKV